MLQDFTEIHLMDLASHRLLNKHLPCEIPAWASMSHDSKEFVTPAKARVSIKTYIKLRTFPFNVNTIKTPNNWKNS